MSKITLKGIIGHTKTVFRHKKVVFVHCCKAGIVWQGIVHDLSKFTPAEFIPGIKYFQGFRSPNEAEREDIGYSNAWIHHKGVNNHHYEHWTDFSLDKKEYVPVKMPLKYVKEMFCDRVAASKIYRGDKYQQTDPYGYLKNRTTQEHIHPETAKLLEEMLRMLAEEGEDAAFAYIRSLHTY